MKKMDYGKKSEKLDMNNFTSIVILSYNTLLMTQMCIESIRSFTDEGTYEIIVIDNASTDGSAEWISKQPDIKYILNKENKGFPKGCNQGMAIAEGSEILLLNSDVIVTPRWLEQLKKALYSSDKIGAVGCLTNKCSNCQSIPVPYDQDNFSIDELIDFSNKFNRSNSSKWLPYLFLVGFCMLFKTSVYKSIGEMDEMFSPGNYEDDDYSVRIRLAGYQILLCQDTFIHHFGSASFFKSMNKSEYVNKAKIYENILIKNKTYFLDKWHLKEDYKKIRIPVNDIAKFIKNSKRVLLVGTADLMDIINLKRYIYGTTFEYLTNNSFDNKMINGDITIYYNTDIIYAIKKIKYDYDYIIVTYNCSKLAEINEIISILNKKIDPVRIIILDDIIING